jgi:hypothetical protein
VVWFPPQPAFQSADDTTDEQYSGSENRHPGEHSGRIEHPFAVQCDAFGGGVCSRIV